MNASIIGPTTATWPSGALGESRIAGIREDDQPSRARIFREARLVSAKVLSVSRQDNLAFDIHAKRLQFVEIFLRAIVGVDNFGGDISISAVRIPAVG